MGFEGLEGTVEQYRYGNCLRTISTSLRKYFGPYPCRRKQIAKSMGVKYQIKHRKPERQTPLMGRHPLLVRGGYITTMYTQVSAGIPFYQDFIQTYLCLRLPVAI